MQERRSSQVFKRKELVARLNPTCQRAFKAAADTAKLRGNPYVELAHFIEQLVLADRGGRAADPGRGRASTRSRLAADMTRAIDRLPYGATSIEEFSDHIFHAIQEGWSYGSLQFGDETVRSAYVLLARAQGAGARRAARQDQRRVRQDRRRRDRRAARGRAGRLDRGRRAAGADAAGRGAAAARAGRRLGAGEVRDRPDRAGAGRQDRPGGRPRPRDPPDRRRADAAAAEQPDPDRRGRGGQDRGGRGLRAAHRRGRRAADAAGREPAHARRRADAGRRQRQGRVREAAARGDRGGAGLRGAGHPLHRRGAHADRRRRRGGHRRRREPPEAGAGARRAAHHRRDHLVGVQAAHREGPGADPPLPGGARSRSPTRRRRCRCCAASPACSRSTTRCRSSTRRSRRRSSLSHRYIPARQLPDKAVSLLDTACARVAVSQHATPAEVEDLRRRRQMLEVEAGIIGREAAIGIDVAARREPSSTRRLAETDAALEAAEARWDARARRWSTQILDLRARLRGEGVPLDAGRPRPAAEPRRRPRPVADAAAARRPRPSRARAAAARPRGRSRRAAPADGRARARRRARRR